MFSLTLLMAVASTASAEEPIILRLINNSSATVESVNTFPIGSDGSVVDDNVGGFYDAIGPGESSEARLSLINCQVVLAIVTLDSGQELRGNVDLCSSDAVTVND